VDDVNIELHTTSTNVKLLENSLCPFYRLHPDIIIEISEYLDPRVCDGRYEPLLCATQICRNWRDTLISQPSRWSFISGSYPGLIPCLLNRSKRAQLDLHIVSRQVQRIIEYINPHVDRLSSVQLEFYHGDGCVFEALRDLSAAPQLRRLNIDCGRVVVPNPPGYTPGIINPIPSLHDLRLVGFPITPELIQLKNLTIVSLDASSATPKAVLDLLSRNSLLKVVHLRGRLIHGDPNDDNGYSPGSIALNHLEVLWLEATPLVHFEALSSSHGARILSGFIRGARAGHSSEGSYTASFPIPTSFSNLRGLQKLRLVDQGEVYVKLEGEKGSISYCIARDSPLNVGTLSGVPLEEVTDAAYEISPLFWHWPLFGPTTSQLMITRIVCGMIRLQKLELSCCRSKEVDYFILVLCSTNVCRDLKVLVLSHCVELYRQMRTLAILAEGRKAADMRLDAVRIVHSNVGQLKATFKPEDVARLEHAVGTLEYVEAELGRPEQSSLKFDPVVGIDQPYIFF